MYDIFHPFLPLQMDAVGCGGVVDVAPFVDVDVDRFQLCVQIRVLAHPSFDGLLFFAQNFLLLTNLFQVIPILEDQRLF